MYPLPGEALSRTLEAEAALADAYAEALGQWVSRTRKLVVPTLEGIVVNGDAALIAASLPPNTDAADENSGAWDDLSTEIILACESSLWCLDIIGAMKALDMELPAITDDAAKLTIALAVIHAITSTSKVTKGEILNAVMRVESDDHLRLAKNDFIASQRVEMAKAPALMRQKAAAAVTAAGPRDGETATMTTVITRQREAAAAVFSPGSPELRDVARYQGYQAASIQNAAVITAGMASEDTDLEKTWIATLDGKTRPTHFAADGQRAPLSGSFSVGGEQLPYPGFPGGSPAEVRNCRCRVGVLAKDEEIPDEVDRHTERLGGRDSTARNREGSQRDEIERRAREGTIRARDDEDGIGRTAGGAPMSKNATIAKKVGEGIVLAADDEEDTGGDMYRTFTDQPIAFIGIETSDGRMLAKDIDLIYRSFPQPVMWTKQTGYGHEDAFTVGVLESAMLDSKSGEVRASGYLLNTAEADEVAGQLEHTASRPSVDLAKTEWKLTDEDGNEITEEQWWEMPIDAKVIQTITAAELIGVTLVATPAFGDTMIQLNAEQETRESSLVASAAAAFKPRIYAASLFSDPGLSEPTLPQMDEETGRLFGHIACWSACHRSVQSKCTIAPRSPSQYGNFHTSPAVRLDNGTRLPVGRLTVGTGHYPTTPGTTAASAISHYDNTGTCFALVRVGEDSHGIWFSGVAAPWATPEQVEMGLSSPLSGDWRDVDGRGLDMIAALAVNTPGFAVRGAGGSDGRATALVASLGPAPSNVVRENQTLTVADIETAVGRALVNVQARNDLTAALAEAETEIGPLPTPSEEIGALLAEAEL